MHTRVPYPALCLLVLMLVVMNGFVFVTVLRPEKSSGVTVSFLDVGQGDSILIEGPTGIEVLIDGGKDRQVLRALPALLGPFDRSIDAVIATHPDADHIGGLPDVLERYQVSRIITSGRSADGSYVDRFAAFTERETGAVVSVAREGMRIHLGDGAYADILHPGDNVEKLRDTNDASVSLRLVYGDTAFMLTGDAPSWVEERLAAAHGSSLKSDVLKAGHHGSKTSTSARFLEAVDPGIVVVSAGKDNSYGHPAKEVLERIQESGAATLSTIESGTITFVSNGVAVTRK